MGSIHAIHRTADQVDLTEVGSTSSIGPQSPEHRVLTGAGRLFEGCWPRCVRKALRTDWLMCGVYLRD